MKETWMGGSLPVEDHGEALQSVQPSWGGFAQPRPQPTTRRASPTLCLPCVGKVLHHSKGCSFHALKVVLAPPLGALVRRRGRAGVDEAHSHRPSLPRDRSARMSESIGGCFCSVRLRSPAFATRAPVARGADRLGQQEAPHTYVRRSCGRCFAQTCGATSPVMTAVVLFVAGFSPP